jgi:poly(beta-D-mannuronate) lyase
MIRYVLFLSLVISGNSLLAKEYPISSAEELSHLELKPGDKVILKSGSWKDQQLLFQGIGTQKKPITLIPEAKEGIKLTGNSNLKINGEWLLVDGLIFAEGYSLKEDVILFSNKSANCRVTNTAIINYNNPDKKVDYKWISVWGHRNRVDHCWLEGKSHQGTTLVIWLDDEPNYDLVDHNYFGSRPELGVNGGETIRIGNSTWSLHDSYTTVENNIFDHCDGELEIISNKSCKNIIRNNLFYESQGTLTLRHGNDADVYDNIFIGNGVPNTGGIRVIAENHKVHDNYLQDLTGTGMSAAISIMDGLPNPPLVGHWQVKNAAIINNTIINCKEPLIVGAGKNAERYLRPENVQFSNNKIVANGPVIRWVDDSAKIRFENNIVYTSTNQEKLPTGFSIVSPASIKKDALGIYLISSSSPPPRFWEKETIGPGWMQQKKFVVK